VVRVSTTPVVALDVGSESEALSLIARLDGLCDFYKIGLELFTAEGPAIVAAIRARGCRVFLDLKLHDIPNTVAGAVRNARRMGARLITVHATGGDAMLKAAVHAGQGPEGDRCDVLAVTVLTSLDVADVASAWGRDGVDIGAEVLRLSEAACVAGAHGVVCSGREAAKVRDRYAGRLTTLVPGVRLAGGSSHDQARVVTPAEAVAAGASYVVLGRAVTAAADPRAAMFEVLRQLG
jgi:orotidine-5'-phosphate decarboxylase